jgi:hypothetical protein
MGKEATQVASFFYFRLFLLVTKIQRSKSRSHNVRFAKLFPSAKENRSCTRQETNV